jgi:hypothetical protein
MTELIDLDSELLAREHRGRQRTKTADARHSHGQSNATRAGHRRLHNRQLDAEPIDQLMIVCGHTRTLRGGAAEWR